MFRFSVRWLLAVTALCCFCLAALNYPTEGMLVLVGLAMSASMLVAIAAAAAGRRRAFSAAYVGGLLVALAFSSGDFVLSRVPADMVVKHAGLYILGPKENAPHPLDASMYSMNWGNRLRGTKVLIDHLRVWRFHRIAKALIAMALAAAAGLLAQWLLRNPRCQLVEPLTGKAEISIRGFAAAAVLTVVAVIALRSGSDAWLMIITVFTLAFLLAASVKAAAFGRAAPLSIGVALAGWAYLMLSIFTFGNSTAGIRLPTEVITSFVIAESLDLPIETLTTSGLSRGEPPHYRIESPSWSYLMNVHRMALLLWSLVIGLVGGMGTVVLIERRRLRSPLPPGEG